MLFMLLPLIILLVGCKSSKVKNNSIEGIWESIGYGEILKIDANSYEYFDITDFSCLPAKEGNILEVTNTMQVSNDTLIVKRGFSIYRYIRIKELPESYQQNIKDKNDISYNFEVFANTYKNHYAYFDLNKIDWYNLYINSKNKINSKSTEVDLYLVMEDMIEKLKDNYLYEDFKAQTFHNIGLVYQNNNQYKKALENFSEGLKIENLLKKH